MSVSLNTKNNQLTGSGKRSQAQTQGFQAQAIANNEIKAAPAHNHWQELSVFLERVPVLARQRLHTIPVGVPDRKLLEKIYAAACSRNLTELLEKHLLSGLLLTPAGQRQLWPVDGRKLIDRCLNTGDHESILQCQWIRAPILVVQGRQTKIVRMLLGQTEHSRQCVCAGTPEPDEQTKRYICSALTLAGKTHGFLYWFLQISNAQAVCGPSLGLPAALAAEFLRHSHPWPDGLYATGKLLPNSTLEPVTHIQEKHQKARHNGCRLFLMPDTGMTWKNPLTDSHSCTTFSDACFAATLYSRKVPADQAAVCQACCCSIPTLLDRFHDLPLPFLKTKQCRQLLKQAAENPRQYLKPLCTCMQHCSHDQQRGQYPAGLFTPAQLEQLLKTEPEQIFEVFDWCLACMSYANHSGRISKAAEWYAFARQMLTEVDPGEAGHLVNHGFITRRFNRYDFRPEPPAELADFLELEEKRQAAGPGSNYLLGALYGTLAQNYGFCGPDYRPSLLEMTSRAEKAFGRKYHRDKERLTNYLIYGFLDAGMITEAKALLNAYLGLAVQCGQDDWFQKTHDLLRERSVDASFKAALTLRLLADTGYLPPEEHNILAESAAAIQKHTNHPGQLIALNLGRILLAAHQLDTAKDLFHRSVRICLAGGDTLQPMALLPLAELHAANLAKKEDYENAQKISRWLSRTTALNRNHFCRIIDLNSPELVLKTVMEQRKTLFPFSYR